MALDRHSHNDESAWSVRLAVVFALAWTLFVAAFGAWNILRHDQALAALTETNAITGERAAAYVQAERFYERSLVMANVVVLLGGLVGITLMSRIAAIRRRERQAMQEAFHQNEAHFRTIYEQSPVAYQSLDAQANVLEVNDAWLTMLGYTREEVVGQPVATFLERSQMPVLQERFQRFLESGRMSDAEFVFVHKDGRSVIASADGRVLRDERGGFLRTLCMLHDITARRHAEEALRGSESRYRALVNQMIVGLAEHEIICDANGHPVDYRFLELNPSFERMTGLSREHLVGRTALEALPGLEPSWVERYGHVAVTGEPLHFESYAKGLDKHFEVTAYQTAPGRFAAMLADVTARKVAEDTVRAQATDQLALEAQLLRAQRLESLGVLAGGVAHDLNNVLSPIMMASAALRDQVDATEPRELIDTIETCAKRGAGVVRQILTFARGIAGDRGLLQPSQVIGEIENILRETLPKSLQIDVAIEARPWSVLGDATQVQQLLMNLCVNARDAMPTHGTLTIACENVHLESDLGTALPPLKPGPYVAFRVTDTGTGIPPEVLNRIFDPFFSTKPPSHGTGLGLSTVLGIARGHAGGLTVQTELGAGTTFTVFLPAQPDAQAPAPAVAEALPPQGHGEMLLLVEDEASIRKLVETTLTRRGYRVLAARNGREALDLFHRERDGIAVVLTDLSMPVMDGAALIRALRGEHPRLPILLMSGLGETLTSAGATGLGANGLLVKPFTMADLLRSVHSLLHGSGSKTLPE